MADEAQVQKPDDGFDEEKFLEQLKTVKEVVEKQDTPAAHGALGELLFSTRRDNYMKEAIPELEIAANGGLAAAKAYLGDAYFNGRGVEKDIPKAIDYLVDAAYDGDVDAMYSLGAAYFMAKEVEADYGKALEYLQEASSLGNSRGTNVLGLMYLGGFGVEQNVIKAKRLFQKAMERGNVHAKQNLDMIKQQGRRFNYHDYILASFAKEDSEQ